MFRSTAVLTLELIGAVADREHGQNGAILSDSREDGRSDLICVTLVEPPDAVTIGPDQPPPAPHPQVAAEPGGEGRDSPRSLP
jgi:hypothetical protein